MYEAQKYGWFILIKQLITSSEENMTLCNFITSTVEANEYENLCTQSSITYFDGIKVYIAALQW